MPNSYGVVLQEVPIAFQGGGLDDGNTGAWSYTSSFLTILVDEFECDPIDYETIDTSAGQANVAQHRVGKQNPSARVKVPINNDFYTSGFGALINTSAKIYIRFAVGVGSDTRYIHMKLLRKSMGHTLDQPPKFEVNFVPYGVSPVINTTGLLPSGW